jgi:ABC-type Zn uptake system ZnuABC Zn-binding protein ZnuA
MVRVPTLIGCLLLLVVACGTEPDSGPGAATGDGAEDRESEPRAEDEQDAAASDPEPSLLVVAKLAPVADLVEMVGGDHVEVASLVPPGADSHTYEPRPSDMARLSDADVFIGIGLDLNPAAASLAEQHLDQDRVILLGERYLDEADLIFDHTHGDDGHTHGDDGHSHGDDGHTHGNDGHSHGDTVPNPHVWTGLSHAASLVDGIAESLGVLDPDHAEDYLDAAEEAGAEIEILAEQVTEAAGTIPEADRTLVVYHDAWSYFARDHGLEIVTAVQPSDYSEPSAGEVRDIIDLIRTNDVPALFGSEVFPSEVLETISEETGATYVGDLADDVLPGAPGDPEHSYLGLMRRNAVLVVDNLGGDASALRR